ncbi:MAG: response regulator transcription factor [Firmicutes bacterium]|nr:response regulator transcription factor [Bacillota bacterium]
MEKDLVLVVDDDQAVRTMLCKIMDNNDFEVVQASSGLEALEEVEKADFDLILLDINMHGMDGFEVINNLRGQGKNMPIMVISGRKADYDTLYGLDIGADEYITKPFNPVTLGAKAKALVRRSKSSASEKDSIIKMGPFTYDTQTLRFYKDEEEIPLSAKENAIIKLFIDNEGNVFSKDMIYSLVWGDVIIDENAIMVYINRLRQKIEDDPSDPQYIQTVRGLGYRFSVK